MKKSLFLSLVLTVFCACLASALTLEPIPEGYNLVVFMNNQANLPAGDIFTKAPIPPMIKEKLEAGINETGFNPFRDITQMQVMGKVLPEGRKAEKFAEGVIVFIGKFDSAKIVEFAKKRNLPIEEEKVGDQTIYKAVGGKIGILFSGGDKLAIGRLSSVKGYLEARGGKGVSQSFEAVKGMISDKAYATVMFGGDDLLKKKLDQRHEKLKQWAVEHPDNPRVKNPVARWLHDYLSVGVNPTMIFANVFDDKVEAKLFYDRPENKGNFVHVLFEVSDPKTKFETLFQEFLKVLPELKPAQGGPAAPPQPQKPVENK